MHANWKELSKFSVSQEFCQQTLNFCRFKSGSIKSRSSSLGPKEWIFNCMLTSTLIFRVWNSKVSVVRWVEITVRIIVEEFKTWSRQSWWSAIHSEIWLLKWWAPREKIAVHYFPSSSSASTSKLIRRDGEMERWRFSFEPSGEDAWSGVSKWTLGLDSRSGF